MAEKIGSAYLEVYPKLSNGFECDLESQGLKSGHKFGSGFSDKMKGAIGAGAVFVGNILASMAQEALNAAGQFLSDSIQTGMDFDKSMSQVAATMGTTVSEIQDLQSFAQEMGRTTAFSATEAAEALNYMALAGYDTNKSMTALPSVLNLAASGCIDLARASDMVTDAQSALGLQFEDLDNFVDQLAKTASTTNTSVSQLGDAVLTVGGTAKMMAGGTVELNQVLGLLADNGIKGAEGGTALRNMLLSLASPTSAASETLSSLGVAVFDAEGNMRSLQDVMQDLNFAMDGMTSEERTQAISNIFNKRDLKSVEALLGTTAERWNEVGNAIANAEGAAQQMADTQLDNLSGDVTMLQSALEGLQIELFHNVEPALRGFVEAATEGIGDMTAGLPSALADLKAFFFGAEAQYDEFGNLVSDKSEGIFDDMSGAFEDIKTVVEIVWPTIERITSAQLEALTTAVGEAWPYISELIKTACTAIREVVELVWPVIDAVVNTSIEAIKQSIESIAPIVDFIGGVFNNVKSAIEGPIETARNFVSGAVENIIGFFSGLGQRITNAIGSIHFPTPHVTWDNLNIGDVASIPIPTVRWYKSGGFVDGATLIGAGESGGEFIWPSYEPYLSKYADALASRMGTGSIIVNLNYDASSSANDLARDFARKVGEIQKARGLA